MNMQLYISLNCTIQSTAVNLSDQLFSKFKRFYRTPFFFFSFAVKGTWYKNLFFTWKRCTGMIRIFESYKCYWHTWVFLRLSAFQFPCDWPDHLHICYQKLKIQKTWDSLNKRFVTYLIYILNMMVQGVFELTWLLNHRVLLYLDTSMIFYCSGWN